MNIKTSRLIAVAATTSIALLGVAACSSDDNSGDAPTTSTTTSGSAESGMMSSGATAAAANPVGPGCAEYAAMVPDGPGSVSGMAQDPVTVAASNNPMLTTLTAAVSGQLNPDVNLVDTLNGGQFTVFAPTDAAFAKLDPATVETLKTDDALLTKILTYHVVPGQLAPSQVDGTHATVEGSDVTVTGSGDNLKVNEAGVVCGGVQTANATVYLVDSVLMPQ
ncbi:fasciclin domain-containing protein [Rhodococcus sp. TAF43]|uniref:fasciclin domain-containing protein n=1 Tax=unclassified Rhodococcus (in: high G+C Gram-positive bacteria) TaxID=192944 RepID=UPI000E0A5139|nr:fasciclin domain-containing protein [Rhodococcus sp. AG1013]RDI34061.1 putative surface protein with fasciclin (FAS1) repeats [Rhodococcus sp. AG1013]